MFYKEEKRNLFSVSEDYYLAHCISADFALGAGIAVQFNKQFDMKNRLKRVHPNYVDTYRRLTTKGDCLLEGRVFNLVTKERYYYKPTLGTMHAALQKMKTLCEVNHVQKIAMPLIGAGLDRLDWKEVSRLLQETFKNTDVEILVCRL